MIKFKIERGIAPPRRGPKPKIADYDALFPLLEKMKPESEESIKITEVRETARNSTYLSVLGVLKNKFEELGGGFRVSTAKIGDGKCEVRVFRDLPLEKKKRK